MVPETGLLIPSNKSLSSKIKSKPTPSISTPSKSTPSTKNKSKSQKSLFSNKFNINKFLIDDPHRTLQYIDEPCNRDFVQPAIKFIVKLLRYSPSSRPSSRQLLDDPFFKEPLDPRTPLLYSPIDTKEMPDIKAMYQDQLIRFSDEVGFQGFQNFIGTFIQPWGYIKVHDLTPGFERGNHCVPVLRMIRKLAEADQFKEFINQENAAQIIEQVLNEQLQR